MKKSPDRTGAASEHRESKRPRALLDRARLGEMLDGVLIIDAHMHLGEWHQFYMPVCDAAGALRIMDRIGIAAGIASGHGAAVGSDLRAGNDVVIDAVKEFPGRFYGYAVADPNDAEGMAAEIERCAKAGLRAIKIHSYHGKPYDSSEYQPAFEIADSRSWPVLAHSGDDLTVFARLAKRYRKIRWVLAHATGGDPEAFCGLARAHENVFLDTCSSDCAYDAVEALVRGAGAEKVLFGSDAVFLSATQQIGKILFARLSNDQKLQILGLNAARVFDLPETPAKPASDAR